MWYTAQRLENIYMPNSARIFLAGPPYRVYFDHEKNEITQIHVWYLPRDNDSLLDWPPESIRYEKDAAGNIVRYAYSVLSKVSVVADRDNAIEKSPTITSLEGKAVRYLEDAPHERFAGHNEQGRPLAFESAWFVAAFALDPILMKSLNSQKIRNQIFISYSHKDMDWLQRIKTHLKPLERLNLINYWDDTKIKVGANWEMEIREALASAKIALLLVSPFYLESDFIADHELPYILKAVKEQGVTLLWVSVRPSLYGKTELAKFQAVNDPVKPLNSLSQSELDFELVRICETVEQAMNNYSSP